MNILGNLFSIFSTNSSNVVNKKHRKDTFFLNENRMFKDVKFLRNQLSFKSASKLFL